MIPAIILAGSHAWKDDAFEGLGPRALLPIGNRALIVHVLEWLRAGGVESVTICANEEAPQLQRVLGDGGAFGLDICYFEDRVPRGPAGCLRDAASLVRAAHYLVIEGAVLPAVALSRLIAFHEEREAAATVLVSGAFGSDRASHRTPVGIFVFSAAALSRVAATGFCDVKEMLIPQLIRSGALVLAYPVERIPQRISDMESYLRAQEYMLARYSAGDVPLAEYEPHGPAWIHPRAAVADGVRLLGPVMVGPDTEIGPDAIMIGPAVLGAGCMVGARAVVGRSVLWDGSAVGAGAVVDQCVVAGGSPVRNGASHCGVVYAGSPR